MIHRCKLLAVLRCLLLMFQLRGHRRNSLLSRSRYFRRCRLPRHSPRSVVTHVRRRIINRGVVNHGIRDRAVVYRNVRSVYIVDRTIVVEPISVPISALITRSRVSIPVINAAVVADM